MSAFFFTAPDGAQADFTAALKNPHARRVFRQLCAWCNVMGQSWTPGGRECADSNEGLRAAGLWLLRQIEDACPGETAALLRESADDWQVFQARRNQQGVNNG